MIFVNEELAEGIYAASGAGTDGDITYSIDLMGTSNLDYISQEYTYNVTIKNNSAEEASSWTVLLKVVEGMALDVKGYDNLKVSVSLRGDIITVTPGRVGSIPANGSITVEMVVVNYGVMWLKVQ